MAALVDQQVLEQLAPAAIVVRSGGEIVRFYGAVEPYLRLPRGEATLDVVTLVRDALKPTLRSALHKAVRGNRKVTLETLRVGRARHPTTLRITVAPVKTPQMVERVWLITLEEVSPPQLPAGAAPRDSDLVRRLEAELAAAKKEQQHLIERLEREKNAADAKFVVTNEELQSTNEELQSTNEELQSTNEELQSTNEELITSEEELHSLNEELTTLNAKLQDKVHELTAVNDDLANLIYSTDIATVFLDTQLRIKRFTTAASHVLNLQSVDTGRPLSHIATNLSDIDLSREAHKVLDALMPVEKEVASRDGRQYFLRGLPYRTQDQQVQGVVLTLVDMTTLKEAERELNDTRAQVAEDLRRMTRLHELAERLAGPGEPRALFEGIVRAAIEITGAEMGGIQEYDDAGALTTAAQVGFDGVRAPAMASQQRLVVADVTASPIVAAGPSRDRMLLAGVRAMQSTPLEDRAGHALGMLSTHYRSPHRFGEAELRWLDLLARHAGIALERRRTEEALARSREELEIRVADRTRWMTLLHSLSQLINEAPTWDSALQHALNHLCETEQWQVGYVYLPDPEQPEEIVPAITCIVDERLQSFHEVSERQRFRRGERLPGQVFSQGKPVWITDPDELREQLPIRAMAAAQVGLRAGVALPVVVGPDVIGVVELFSDQPHPRKDWFDNLMPAVGDQIGRVLERERTAARMADLVWREQQDLLHTLHDSLGQTLTGLGMLSSSLRQRLAGGEPEAADASAEIATQAQQALEQVRRLSRSLFPLEVEAASLTAALRDLAFATESLHKIPVRVEGGVPQSFRDGGAATQLYRIAQEAVTNAVKHSQARNITIQIDGQAGMVQLRIADDGVGIGNAAAGNGIGLQIMRYRAHTSGGVFNIEPGPQGGTVVTCKVRAAPRSRKSAPECAGAEA